LLIFEKTNGYLKDILFDMLDNMSKTLKFMRF